MEFRATSGRIITSTRGPMFLSRFQGAVIEADVRELQEFQRRYIETEPRYVAITNVVGGGMNVDEATRRASNEMIDDAAENNLASVVLFEVPGLKGAAIRTIIATILLASPSRHPRKVTGDLESAIDWLVKQQPELTDPAVIREIYASWGPPEAG